MSGWVRWGGVGEWGGEWVGRWVRCVSGEVGEVCEWGGEKVCRVSGRGCMDGCAHAAIHYGL